jgi:hypothetical protein
MSKSIDFFEDLEKTDLIRNNIEKIIEIKK